MSGRRLQPTGLCEIIDFMRQENLEELKITGKGSPRQTAMPHTEARDVIDIDVRRYQEFQVDRAKEVREAFGE